ncbi:MAG: hypothetical protein QXY49_04490 [Thermofilaceae archaeon]
MAPSSCEIGKNPTGLREELLKAFIEALADLKTITIGLAKITWEKAAEVVIADLGIPRLPDPAEGLKNFISSFGESVEVETGEEVEVVVKSPCFFSLKNCAELCPLPHVSAVYLKTLSSEEWVPRRAGKAFVEMVQGGCKFRLVKIGSSFSRE